jgi:pentatricopeptide repeat protein
MDEIELYRQIISKDPCSQAFVYLAEALWESKMYTEAIETCVNGLRLHPHDLRARVILGLSYLRTGELDLAEAELLKAEEMLEINSVTYQALAEIYDQQGDTDQASRYRQLFEAIFSPAVAKVEAEAAEPEIESLSGKVEQEDDGVATVTMAELYVKQGHLEEAIEVYRRILRRNPETEGVVDRLAELKEKLGKAKTARTLLLILETWQNKLQEGATAESASPPAEAVGIDPEKLAAIVQNYVK